MAKPITKRMPSMPSMPRRPSMPSMPRPSMPSLPRPSMPSIPSIPSLPWTGGSSNSSSSEKDRSDRSDRSDVSDQENGGTLNRSKSKRYKSMMSKMKNPLKKKRKQMMQHDDDELGESKETKFSGGSNVDEDVLSALPVRFHKTLHDLDVFSDDEADEEEAAIMSKNKNNPWFTPEIASIVKLCRKYRRKHHKSKTKKTELKEICRELEKRKRKLIRAAKQKWNGSQKPNASDGAGSTVDAQSEKGNDQEGANVEEQNQQRHPEGEGVSPRARQNDGGGDKMAVSVVINDRAANETDSAVMMVTDIDPPTPPLLTPDPPVSCGMVMDDDLYDPVYEIYLMLMREDNAGANSIEAPPPPHGSFGCRQSRGRGHHDDDVITLH